MILAQQFIKSNLMLFSTYRINDEVENKRNLCLDSVFVSGELNYPPKYIWLMMESEPGFWVCEYL